MGIQIPTEIEAMESLGIDIMGMSETNCPWTPQAKAEFDFMMNQRFQTSRTIYSSAPPLTPSKYQPGGTLLTITGHTTGRIMDHGSDPWGRFCWHRLRGRREEGILIISAYRVCQQKTHNPGPFTAFQQQYTLMRQAGIPDPNPRQRLLDDLSTLIQTHRAAGYRPILMLDANGDYEHNTSPDKALAGFLIDSHLVDPFYDKFNSSPRTYLHGTKRIDYIFTDPAISHSLQRIGYLGTHMGADSDHCLAYIDIDENKLFQGLINRPVPHHSRELQFSQADKVKKFVTSLENKLDEHSIPQRITELAHSFALHSATQSTIAQYNALYGEFMELTRSTAKRVGRKKYGYNRSPTLTTTGQLLLLYKHTLGCKRRKSVLTQSILSRCAKYDISSTLLTDMTLPQLRSEIRHLRQDHWTSKKNSETLRSEWLTNVAKDRARALDDPDWEKKLREMKRTVQTNALNRKLTAILKGARGVLDRVQVPIHDWFFSPGLNELYHYDSGVFEAYPACDNDTFHTHHTIKILPNDAELVTVDQSPPHNRWTITGRLTHPPQLWRDLDTQEEIEQHLIEHNRRHLEQTAREQGPSTHPPLTTIRRHYGLNPITDHILNGTLHTTYDLTPEMTAFFDALKSTPRTASLPPVLGTINSEQFQEMFRHSKEKTSSDSRTLNYSIWKCIASSDRLSGFAAILLSLPFMYGFVNTHWTHMSDFMLEKKPGVPHIHQLRIIGKVSAEFNTCLKYYIGHKAMHNFERADPDDEQHGFRPHRSSIDAAMLKLLSFECARIQRSTMCMVQHDMTAHFDRMYPAMSSIYASRYKVDRNILLSIAKTIQWLKRNVETALGVSKSHYEQLPGAPAIGGMVQGKADVPQLSTQQSDAMLKAHKIMTDGLSLPNPTANRTITHHNISFADDTDNHTNTASSGTTPVLDVVKKAERSAQTWSKLVNICGGLLALHKCNWQLIAWDDSSGHMELLKDPGTILILRNAHGTPTIIDYLPPNKPNVGLGFHICPDGNQVPQLKALTTAIHTLCHNIASSFLTELEMNTALTQRLIPKLQYVLHSTSFTQKQSNKLNSTITHTFLPRMRMNRHFPRAVLYGPIKHGGMAFPEIHALQLSTQIQYLIKQLRWNHTVANDFLVTLDSLQLLTGVGTPLLEVVTPTIKYAGHSFILSLRHQLAHIEAQLWVEDKWTHPPQREHDEFIMDRFLHIANITTLELRQANAVRLYLRVLTLADLADPSGTFIPDGNLSGDWQGGSDIHWPYQTKPPKKFWATFRRCMRHTFCTTTSPHQPAHYGMALDTPLGRWLPVPRHSWFNVYRSPTNLYWRVDTTIRALKPTTDPGFYIIDREVTELPLDCHPISFQNMGDQIWTHRKYTMGNLTTHTPLPAGIEVVNNVTHLDHSLQVGCDASLHPYPRVATCAWVIETPDKAQIQAHFHIQNLSSFSTYRSELEGIYRSLLHVKALGLRPPHIQQWCDNKAAITNAAATIYSPNVMTRPDMDIILAVHQLRLEYTTTCTLDQQHVYGHQDTRTVQHDHLSPSDLSTTSFSSWGTSTPKPPRPKPQSEAASRLNILSDEIANSAAEAVMRYTYPTTETHGPPYPGSKAILRIGETWITSHIPHHIQRTYHTKRIRDYCMNKYHWSLPTFNSLYWTGIERARNRGTKTQLMFTSKLIHGWLPVNHMVGHSTHISQCPGCLQQDETFNHLFQCPHPGMTSIRIKQLHSFENYLRKANLPRNFTRPFSTFLHAAINGDPEPHTDNPLAQEAFQSQMTIGQDLFIRGLLSTEWLHLLSHSGYDRPDNALTNIIWYLWHDFFRPIWDTRNQILHRSKNNTTAAIESGLDKQLIWFLDNKHEVLARSDFFLARYSREDIGGMSLAYKREQIRHLEVAKASWEVERMQRHRGQTVITSYFSRKLTTTPGDST